MQKTGIGPLSRYFNEKEQCCLKQTWIIIIINHTISDSLKYEDVMYINTYMHSLRYTPEFFYFQVFTNTRNVCNVTMKHLLHVQ
jgi:hypothetical protein